MGLAVNNVVRCVYFQRMFAQRILTVLHLRVKVPVPGATTEALEMLELSNFLGDPANDPLVTWVPQVTPDVSFDEVRVQKVYPARGVYQKDVIGVTGSFVGSSMTANLAVSIEKRTLHAGRPGIGRIQMAGVPDSKIIDGEIDSTYLNNVTSAWQSLLGDVTVPATGGVYRFCLFGGTAVGENDDIFDVQGKSAARTMHRRTLRVGE